MLSLPLRGAAICTGPRPNVAPSGNGLDGSLRGQGAPLPNGSNGGALCHKVTLSAICYTVPQHSRAPGPIMTMETESSVAHG
jgi:hypothetical protein